MAYGGHILKISKFDVSDLEAWKNKMEISEDVYFAHVRIDAAVTTRKSFCLDFENKMNCPISMRNDSAHYELMNLQWISSNRIVILIEGLLRNEGWIIGQYNALDYILSLREHYSNLNCLEDGKTLEIFGTD